MTLNNKKYINAADVSEEFSEIVESLKNLQTQTFEKHVT